MFHVPSIKNWFKGKAADFNKIADFLNNICGDGFIHITKPDKPSNGAPPVISLDTEKLQGMLSSENTAVESKTAIDATQNAMQNDYVAEEDAGSEPITPESQTANELWKLMTKDEKNSTEEKTYYLGWKENAVIAITEQFGTHYLWYVEKEYTPDGRLKSVSKLKGYTLIGA
jgi:hypothetical protein